MDGLLNLLMLAVAWMIFLSTERIFRGLLAPISDGTEDDRKANPVVMGWKSAPPWSNAKESTEEF